MHCETALVVVYNDWNSAIGAQLSVPWLLLDVLADINALPGIFFAICFLELFKNDARLPAIGCALNQSAIGHVWSYYATIQK